MFNNAATSLILSLTATAAAFCQVGFPGAPSLPSSPIFNPNPIQTITPTIPILTADFGPLVIASIGDSNAAGEGVPNTTGSAPSIWSLAQCHRSENNGRTMAANALKPLVDLEYSNFACSGGTINVGLRGPYVGMPVNGNFLDAANAQIQQVKDWMNSSLRRKNLDVLIISVGVNDVGFGHVVGACLDPLSGPNHNGNCASNSEVTSIIANGDPDSATTVLGLNRLDGALNDLFNDIKNELHPRYVLITEYFNPVHDEKGAFCNAYDENFEVAPVNITSGNLAPVTGILKWLAVGGAMKNVHDYESQFVEQSLLKPLNTHLKNFAQLHSSDGWIYVGGMVEMSMTHGFCSKTPWVNTLKASWTNQHDMQGTAHLNKAGQKAYQWLLQKKIIELFNIQVAPPVELFDAHVTQEYIGDRKRVVVEVSPTVDFVSGEVMYKLNSTPTAALIQPETAHLTRDTSFATRQVYYADLPGTENLGYMDEFYYTPVIHYGKDANHLTGFISLQPKEYVVFRYQEISSN